MLPEIGDAVETATAEKAKKIPIALPRWREGNQRVMKKITPGKYPASATPSRKRTAAKLVTSVISAVEAEARPQAKITTVSHRRAPIRASMRLLGTWNST